MTAAALALAPVYVTPGAVLLFLLTSAVTLCFGHSLGLHRLLIHRSFVARPWLGRTMMYLGTLVGMAGPLGMVRLHDMRDWAQRQDACHDMHAHRAGPLRNAWWQLHCRLALVHPPHVVLEPGLAQNRFLRGLDATWMAQQLPWAILFYAAAGLPERPLVRRPPHASRRAGAARRRAGLQLAISCADHVRRGVAWQPPCLARVGASWHRAGAARPWMVGAAGLARGWTGLGFERA